MTGQGPETHRAYLTVRLADLPEAFCRIPDRRCRTVPCARCGEDAHCDPAFKLALGLEEPPLPVIIVCEHCAEAVIGRGEVPAR